METAYLKDHPFPFTQEEIVQDHFQRSNLGKSSKAQKGQGYSQLQEKNIDPKLHP